MNELKQENIGKKPYMIDDIEADGNDIIAAAKEYGYEGYAGVFQTSIAAKILRENGFKVMKNPDYV